VQRHLVREFCEFYQARRCPCAPANPMRIFRLGETLYKQYLRRITPAGFMSVLYETLQSIFQRFDPTKYQGQRPIEDHFANFFKKTLWGNLRRAMRPRSDMGRKGNRQKFHPQPELGLRIAKESLHTEWAHEEIHEAVSELPQVEQSIIRGRYWADLSEAKVAKSLGIDRRTVKKRHDMAIERLRKALAT